VSGNDGVLRIDLRSLGDLPPPDTDHGQTADDREDTALTVLRTTVDDLRTDLERTRTALDKAMADRLDDHGRAERAETRAAAEASRADAAERRLEAAEAALAEARTPWAVRLVRAFRGT
jgi:chromosome segregation ATPase